MTNLAKFIIASFLLTACASATQKAPTKWNVKATTEGQQKIWVSKPDGSRQCAPKGKALSPSLAAEQLKGVGVPVFEARNGNDGKMYIQKCGSPTGSTVDLEISRRDITKALSLGFVTKSTVAE